MKLATRPNCTLIFLLAILLVATFAAGLGERGVGGAPVWYESRRMMIGSTMPTCTYNECRGCRHKCIAEQIPVEGNDPINSAYHYRCVCRGST